MSVAAMSRGLPQSVRFKVGRHINLWVVVILKELNTKLHIYRTVFGNVTFILLYFTPVRSGAIKTHHTLVWKYIFPKEIVLSCKLINSKIS